MKSIRPFAVAIALAGLVGCGGDAPETEVVEAPMPEAPAGAMTETPMPAPSGLLDANQATREQLVAAGLTAETAEAVVAGRPYDGVMALDRALAGRLDEPGRETVYRSVWIPIELNTASQEEILLIPGMGERMLHEFEEYRPYRGMEEFRREIGKYVDGEELARLEQYVMLR